MSSITASLSKYSFSRRVLYQYKSKYKKHPSLTNRKVIKFPEIIIDILSKGIKENLLDLR